MNMDQSPFLSNFLPDGARTRGRAVHWNYGTQPIASAQKLRLPREFCRLRLREVATRPTREAASGSHTLHQLPLFFPSLQFHPQCSHANPQGAGRLLTVPLELLERAENHLLLD